MPRPDNYFTELAGAAAHYARFTDPQYSYGTRGKPYRFYCTSDFENKLNACFEELWDVCSLGKAEVITSAGAYVDKRGSHGQGRGFDLDAIFWSNKSFVTLHYPQDRAFYMGVEAILRKHFGMVLNYSYNRAHRDHFHIDDTAPTGFNPHRSSIIYFTQMALTDVHNIPVAIDGIIGPQTNNALRELLVQLEIANHDDVSTDSQLYSKMKDEWASFLQSTAGRAFADLLTQPKNPLDLLQDAYSIIENELDGDERRKRIEAALTTFASHEDTEIFLDQYRT